MTTNLHLQKFSVFSYLDNKDHPSEVFQHECFTCGAFTAFSEGYAHGGIRRQSHRRSSLSPVKNSSSCTDWTALAAFVQEWYDIQRQFEVLMSIFKSTAWIDMKSGNSKFIIKIFVFYRSWKMAWKLPHTFL